MALPHVAIGGKAVGGGIVRIEFDGPIEETQRLAAVLEGQRVVQRQRAQEQVIGVGVVRRLAAGALDLGTAKPRFDGSDDAGGDPVLKIEDVAESAVEPIAPQMDPGRRIDELAGDAHARSSTRRTLPSSR